jgi:hypothetical protein
MIGMTGSDSCSCEIALPRGHTEVQEEDHAEKGEIAGGKPADGDIT